MAVVVGKPAAYTLSPEAVLPIIKSYGFRKAERVVCIKKARREILERERVKMGVDPARASSFFLLVD